MLLQGSQLGFIKIPKIRDAEKMKRVCINALTNEVNVAGVAKP